MAVAAIAIGLSGCIDTCRLATGENLSSFKACSRDAIYASSLQPLRPAFTIENRIARVSSRRPTLEWAPVTEVIPGNASNVRYDLAIWKGVNPRYSDGNSFSDVRYSRGGVWISVDSLTLVYERDGLTTTTHTLETELEANMEYVWSVRERFDIDGKTRVSEWSLVSMPEPIFYGSHGGQGLQARDVARATGQLPPYALFYFRTPGGFFVGNVPP
jgi:hypothetical protein